MSLKIPADLQIWIEARKRFKLSHVQVQMARELGMNPKKLGASCLVPRHGQEPWKAPLPQFIEELYFGRFSRAVPERVISLEERARELAEKKRQRREARAKERETKGAGEPVAGGEADGL